MHKKLVWFFLFSLFVWGWFCLLQGVLFVFAFAFLLNQRRFFFQKYFSGLLALETFIAEFLLILGRILWSYRTYNNSNSSLDCWGFLNFKDQSPRLSLLREKEKKVNLIELVPDCAVSSYLSW